MEVDGTAVLVASISAVSATFGAYLAYAANRKLNTGGPQTVGQQIGVLDAKVAKVAEAKVLADAKLAGEALTAIAEAVKDANPVLSEAARAAAATVVTLAESETVDHDDVLAVADRTAAALLANPTAPETPKEGP